MNPAQLQQVFVNLIRNAVEAAPERSSVSVDLSHDQNSARVTIADRGPGVSPQDRAQLFQPFFTTKPQGVGLGLAISREIVEAHSGAIDFESGPEGTTVTVRLPVERESERGELRDANSNLIRNVLRGRARFRDEPFSG